MGGGEQGRANADANTQDTTLLVFHAWQPVGNVNGSTQPHTPHLHAPHLRTPARARTHTPIRCTNHHTPHSYTHTQLIHTTPPLPPRPPRPPAPPRTHTHVSDALALLAMPGIAGRPPPGARFSVTIPGVPAGPARCPTRAWGEVSSCISPPCRPWNRRNGLGRSIPSADTSADAASRRAERRVARQDVMGGAEDGIRCVPASRFASWLPPVVDQR